MGPRWIARSSLLALCACAFCAVTAPASQATVTLTFAQGTPDVMTATVSAAPEKFQVGNPDVGDDYTFTTACAGCSNTLINANAVPAGLCAPVVSQTVVCDPAESGDPPYRVVIANPAVTMDVLLSEPNSSAA